MKILIMIAMITGHIFSSPLTEIPTKYKDVIKVTSPKNNLITINNKLKIEGRVKNNIQVFINKKPIKKDAVGKYKHIVQLNELGKHQVTLTFKTKKDTVEILKNIIKLKNPKSVIMTQKELAFINTDYTSEKIKTNSLNNTFKKEELAYFLNKIRTKAIESQKKINNIDKIKRYKSHIQDTVNANILSLNSQGNFNPNGTVTNLFLLAGISRALDYEPSEKKYPEISKYKNQWFYKYLQIGLDKKIIKPKELSQIKSTLSTADFIKYASRIPELKEAILVQLSFKKNPPIPLISQPVKTQKIIEKHTPTKLSINGVYETSKTSKEIHGIVTPARHFTLNWRKITPDKNGNFTAKIPKNQQRIHINFGNQILVEELPGTIRKTEPIVKKRDIEKVIQPQKTVKIKPLKKEETIKPYKDINTHWIKAIANELKKAGKLENTENFNPNKKMTRADLAKYMVKINDLTPKKLKRSTFTDIDKTNSNYTYIQNVVSNKLLKGMTTSTFAPNINVTKLQAIIVASRLLPDTDESQNITLPYSDIQRYKWANASLKKAYYYKIISDAPKLNPKKSVSNAELVSILYKTSKI